MKITRIVGREIFDSRGVPTVECDLFLEDGHWVTASVPAGLSRGTFEAVELRDGGDRLGGMGVLRAVETIDSVIAPLLIGHEPDVVTMDLQMISVDGTDDKSNLGANSMLAVSVAVCKAQALINEIELYEMVAHLCDLEQLSLPIPMFNVLNGGMHADNSLTMQEIMIVPLAAQNFRHAMEVGVTVFGELKKLLRANGKSTLVGDEGGFAPDIAEDEAFDLLTEAIILAGAEEQVAIAIDIAATRLYQPSTGHYVWDGQEATSEDLVAYYAQLCEHYPIYSIEDGLADSDTNGWKQMMEALGSKIQIVGDDLFVTNPARITAGLSLANGVLIKPNQIGTITETMQAIMTAKKNELNIIISHRSGETNDTYISDIAVGASAGQIKAGSCSRGERLAKYNRLLRIEDMLMNTLME